MADLALCPSWHAEVAAPRLEAAVVDACWDGVVDGDAVNAVRAGHQHAYVSASELVGRVEAVLVPIRPEHAVLKDGHAEGMADVLCEISAFNT